jgi:hypothetical protein
MFAERAASHIMHNRRATLLLLATVLFALPGCYYDTEEELYPNSFCDTTNVTWTADIQPLIQSSCAIPGCHVPGSQSPNLTSYSAVQTNAAAIKGVIVDGAPFFMPPSGRLPSCDQQKVSQWVAAGAPQN